MTNLEIIKNYDLDKMAEHLENMANCLSFIWLPDEKFVPANKENFKKWLMLEVK